ncbi:hypothetical protein MRX96_021163 [Rhipicephalus microplus]
MAQLRWRRAHSVGASSPGPAISGGGDSPSSLNPARSRLAGPSGVLAAVECMAGFTWSDQETYELIRISGLRIETCSMGRPGNNKVKEKLKRLRKDYKYDKCSKKIATYHDALATVLAQGSKGSSLFIKSEVDESMGSEELRGTDSEANYIEKRSEQKTYELIRIWAVDRDLLDGTSRNNKAYESMAAQMRSLGYLRTALQVKENMKRLHKE